MSASLLYRSMFFFFCCPKKLRTYFCYTCGTPNREKKNNQPASIHKYTFSQGLYSAFHIFERYVPKRRTWPCSAAKITSSLGVRVNDNFHHHRRTTSRMFATKIEHEKLPRNRSSTSEWRRGAFRVARVEWLHLNRDEESPTPCLPRKRQRTNHFKLDDCIHAFRIGSAASNASMNSARFNFAPRQKINKQYVTVTCQFIFPSAAISGVNLLRRLILMGNAVTGIVSKPAYTGHVGGASDSSCSPVAFTRPRQSRIFAVSPKAYREFRFLVVLFVCLQPQLLIDSFVAHSLFYKYV